MAFRDEMEALRAQLQTVKKLNEEFERKLELALVHDGTQRKELREEIHKEVKTEADTEIWKLQQQVDHFDLVQKADTANSWRIGFFSGLFVGAVTMLLVLSRLGSWEL